LEGLVKQAKEAELDQEEWMISGMHHMGIMLMEILWTIGHHCLRYRTRRQISGD
jgi:hypothetical protein